MHLKTRNVNTAFRDLVRYFRDGSSPNVPPRGSPAADRYDNSGYLYVPNVVREHSRNGPVLRIDEPVLITYTHPRERVLFNAVRDANPFFHVFEALWMLAGRNDVAPLAYYCKRMREFSDDGVTLNGAYGYRWRHAHRPRKPTDAVGTELELVDDGRGNRLVVRVDQLDVLVAHLKADPASRRAVLQMWNVEDDLLKIGYETGDGLGNYVIHPPSRDVCCNLSVMFSLRTEREAGSWPHGVKYLDMTVTNRSNDLLWGLLGANFVHFTFLQEYVAARLGVQVGLYHHFTNNLHVYADRKDWRPEELLEADGDLCAGSEYQTGTPMTCVPLVRDPEAFERELPEFVQHYANPDDLKSPFQDWDEPFFNDVARPMLTTYLTHKRRGATTLDWADRIMADDWRVAATGWLKRRAKQ